MSSAVDAERELMRMALTRPAVKQLFYPSLESEVCGEYMLHRRRHHTDEAWIHLIWGMHTSRTLYIGNLSFTTREEQVHELFSRVGRVTRVIMGLNAQTRTPCGFAFVEMARSSDAAAAAHCLSGLKLDERVIRADLDQEFEQGRQFGRSKSGGQLADDYRADFDAGRGGWGAAQQAKQERREAAEKHKQAQMDQFGAAGDENQEEEFDPTETVDRVRSVREDERAAMPLKLSASTIAALTEGVFPHYALPVDARVQKALQLLQGGATAATAATPSQPAAASAAIPTAAALPPSKRPVSPTATSVASAAAAAGSSSPPPSKRPRQQRSPRSMAAVSPPPRSRSPVPFAAAAASAAPSSPRPFSSSPQPASGGAGGGGEGYRSPVRMADTAASTTSPPWSPPERGYTPTDELSDGDRTPPPPRSPQPRSPQPLQQQPARHEQEEEHAELAHDDATPPPSRSPSRLSHSEEDQHQPPHHEELGDDDHTPQHHPHGNDDDHHDRDAHAGANANVGEIDDDAATPGPPPEDEDADMRDEQRRNNNQDSNEPDYAAFE